MSGGPGNLPPQSILDPVPCKRRWPDVDLSESGLVFFLCLFCLRYVGNIVVVTCNPDEPVGAVSPWIELTAELLLQVRMQIASVLISSERNWAYPQSISPGLSLCCRWSLTPRVRLSIGSCQAFRFYAITLLRAGVAVRSKEKKRDKKKKRKPINIGNLKVILDWTR